MTNWEGKPRAWLAVAEAAGLSLANVDKACIKKVLRAVHDSKCALGVEPLLVHSPKVAQELVKAVEQMKTMQATHLQEGGRVAEPFITRLCFKAEDVDAYLANPRMPVNSLPIFLSMANNIDIKIVLSWRDRSMWLSAFALCNGRFHQFGMHLRSVSSQLILRKDFVACTMEYQQPGTGLCCMLQKPAELAESMKAGILCTGLLHDLEASTPNRGSARLNALQLDDTSQKAYINQLSRRVFVD
jgi:hypothetical protein